MQEIQPRFPTVLSLSLGIPFCVRVLCFIFGGVGQASFKDRPPPEVGGGGEGIRSLKDTDTVGRDGQIFLPEGSTCFYFVFM